MALPDLNGALQAAQRVVKAGPGLRLCSSGISKAGNYGLVGEWVCFESSDSREEVNSPSMFLPLDRSVLLKWWVSVMAEHPSDRLLLEWLSSTSGHRLQAVERTPAWTEEVERTGEEQRRAMRPPPWFLCLWWPSFRPHTIYSNARGPLRTGFAGPRLFPRLLLLASGVPGHSLVPLLGSELAY